MRLRTGVSAGLRYSATMTPESDQPRSGDSADFDRLARRYLDLWQSQLSGLASDQALTEQVARLFAAANAQVASAIQAAQGGPNARSSAPTGQAGSASAAAASQHGADDVGELRKRVAALEHRIAELEADRERLLKERYVRNMERERQRARQQDSRALGRGAHSRFSRRPSEAL